MTKPPAQANQFRNTNSGHLTNWQMFLRDHHRGGGRDSQSSTQPWCGVTAKAKCCSSSNDAILSAVAFGCLLAAADTSKMKI